MNLIFKFIIKNKIILNQKLLLIKKQLFQYIKMIRIHYNTNKHNKKKFNINKFLNFKKKKIFLMKKIIYLKNRYIQNIYHKIEIGMKNYDLST